MLNNDTCISKNESAAIYLLEQAMGITFQASLRVAALLDIADKLKNGAKTIDELAKESDVNPKHLFRVMRMLAAKKVFAQTDDGKFELTPAAQFLRKDHPHSLHDAVLMLTDITFWAPLGDLIDSLRSDTPFKDMFGESFYEYWADESHYKDDYTFHTGMSSMSAVENYFLTQKYKFPDNAKVVDIAGGMGGLLLSVLKSNKTLHGILFDRPEILQKHRLGELDGEKRWEIHPGSFFESCPEADFYLLKYITMDWPTDQAQKILQCCRNAMNDNSKLLILEPVIPTGNNWHGGNLIDLLLLASFDGGQTRSEEELTELLDSAGLKLNRIIDTGCYVSIVEAIPKPIAK
ncbi:methyltransferase [Providencia sneebia]|uniref:Putative O-methyltransferase n=1 Tax=Providencia sneebia DSM 19967 TaxID=1141660 RepID=K8WPW0_9GAMM|nr:methyltransferase [Providencia sneebia]EKT59502.1 putative O-methyltransferase [Providencia sneebia DSM 19967]